MAKISNAFETRDAVGNREDLESTIYNIDPTDTPFHTMAGRRGATNTQFDWQTEAMPDADDDNAQEEGFELTRTASQPTVRRKNVVQISKRDATVSGSQEGADAAGKSSEMAHQMALKSKILKCDMEKIALGDQALDDGLDDGKRRTRAFGHWISTNVSRGAGGANPVSETAAPTPGTARKATEPMVRMVMQTAYDNGAKPKILLTGSVNKLVVDEFEGRTNSRHNVAPDTATQGLAVYASDFGNLSIKLDRWMPQDRLYGIDPAYVKFAYYRRFKRIPLAKIGDAETNMILAEWGLQVSNEKAHFAIFDLHDNNTDNGFTA